MTTLIALIRSLWHKLFPQKPVIIAVHGFGVRRSDELIPLRDYYRTKGYTVLTPNLFDQTDETDAKAKAWIDRAESVVKEAVNSGQKVWLVGFSMGGVIASRLAALYPVERLVLLAPAFDYVSTRLVKLKVQEIVDDLLNRSVPDPRYAPLPESFKMTFREVIADCGPYVTQVKCPVLLLHGTADEVIPVRSSEGAFAKIPHDRKRLLMLYEVQHRILDSSMQADVLTLIHNFFVGKLLS
jgi:esterase/lipase